MWNLFDENFEEQLDIIADKPVATKKQKSQISNEKVIDGNLIFRSDKRLALSSWRADGLCSETDPEIFFPTQNTSTIKLAKRVCDLCPVQNECLEYALKHNIHCGIWGGLTENERRKIKRNRNQGDHEVRITGTY